VVAALSQDGSVSVMYASAVSVTTSGITTLGRAPGAFNASWKLVPAERIK
jgi:hypothetical protein